MTSILATLLSILKAEFVDADPRVISTVLILDEGYARGQIRSNNLPAIIIYPLSATFAAGPFSRTGQMAFRVGIRCIYRTTRPEAYQVDPISGTSSVQTIHDILDRMQTLLYVQKLVTPNVFTMLPEWQVRYGAWAVSEGTYVPAFDLQIGYTDLRSYLGPVNDQDSLQPPDVAESIDWEQ